MLSDRRTKIIVTLGPTLLTEEALQRLKAKGVDFVRTNMSHSSLEELRLAVDLARKVGLPFIIDTEGSQVRTGNLEANSMHFRENAVVQVTTRGIATNKEAIVVRPPEILEQLEEGDLLHIDFDSLILRVCDTSTARNGSVTTRVITSGFVGANKAVVVDPVMDRKLDLPVLSAKDFESIDIGLRAGVKHVAVSFVRSSGDIQEVREVTKGEMKIISKIECRDALAELERIVRASDLLLIDRGDLSKEIPIERIPPTQKVIIDEARRQSVGVFVATNLLESMVRQRRPTRAEAHDVITTVADGASGLTLAAETAVGKYPMECVNMINRLIRHAEAIIDGGNGPVLVAPRTNPLPDHRDYLSGETGSSALVEPHGGQLVNRSIHQSLSENHASSLPRVVLTEIQRMELEQIALGTYSPIDGFLGEADFESVLETMKLADGTVWPLPIVLDVSTAVAGELSAGQDVALRSETGELVGILHLEEQYTVDREALARRLFGTTSSKHPGVRSMYGLESVFLGGKVDLLRRRNSTTKEYELSPRQVRRLFDEKGWTTVLGFHTRNVIHRGHEFLQLQAMEREFCDGLFVHPIIGRKKPGDYHTKYIVKSYETMMNRYYPRKKVVFGVWSTFSRYAGPREALFTALCRKNFGCSHFIVGRDHTGVGDYYEPDAAHRIFDEFEDLGIVPVRYSEVLYSGRSKNYFFAADDGAHESRDILRISGTEARSMFAQGKKPPAWYMRPEISKIIVEGLRRGDPVFQ